MKTAVQIAQEYKDRLAACRILWDIGKHVYVNQLPRLPEEFQRVADYLSAQREQAWRELIKLPVEQFADGMNASKVAQ